ncbi:uncharacterized protein LOC118433794 [Folsomia candida]|nr:uncharacterized protein LOC118433794 [Folsomia candida]
MEYPLDVYHINNQSKFRTKLFYYEDTAEIQYELNIGIDIAWKIWATVAGYCSTHYMTRQSETFTRFYTQYFQDFLQPVTEDWISPEDNEVLRVILSDYNSDVGMRWLDTCLEGSYIDSNTPTFRPPRPLLVKGDKTQLEKANSFLDTPTWLKSNVLNDSQILLRTNSQNL